MAKFLSRFFHRKPGLASERLELAERANGENRYADGAVLFRELAEAGDAAAR